MEKISKEQYEAKMEEVSEARKLYRKATDHLLKVQSEWNKIYLQHKRNVKNERNKKRREKNK